MPESQSRRARPIYRPLLSTLALTVALGTGGSLAGLNDAHASKPMPRDALAAWQEHMIEAGRHAGDQLRSLQDLDERLNAQYYDAQWVFLRIAEFTGESDPWSDYAKAAEKTYKRYLEENNFQVAGYRKFPHGLYADWKINGDDQSREYLLRMREQSPFSDPTSQMAEGWYQQRRSREVAYSLQTEVLAARAGAGEPRRMKKFADMALRHIEAWTTGNYINRDPELQFSQSFMGGLTASALIDYYQYTVKQDNPDQRVPAAVRSLADWLWEEMWVGNVDGSGYGAFKYVQPPIEGVGAGGPAPDLNMLIAPMYGWLYYQTSEAKYAKRGDKIFAGGVALAKIEYGGKHFNQNYRSSFDYVMWRAAGNGGGEIPLGPTAAWAPGMLR